MIYHHLYKKYGQKANVLAGIVGAGNYATAIITQEPYTEYLKVPAVADISAEKAKQAYQRAGVPEDKLVYCDTAQKAQEEIEKGNYVYTDHCQVISQIPSIDIICEGTGSAEAGAAYALDAINNGKHVAMITKDCDSSVGPVLKQMADNKNLVYTTVDGDQHGLLIQLYEWAKSVGLTVISGGKATDGEYIYSDDFSKVTIKTDKKIHPPFSQSIEIKPEDRQYLKMIPEGKAKEYIDKRAEILSGLPGPGSFDLCETVIAANYTGMKPFKETLVHAPLRITELPIAYAAQENGGVFADNHTIDLVTCLRGETEGGLGGGVFLVIKCDNAYSNHVLTTKGQIANYDNSTAVIYRPYHLCGVESSASLLVAGLLGLNTASDDYKPRFDLVKVAARDIKAGEIFENDHSPQMTARIMPAQPIAPGNYASAHLLTANEAAVDIPKGTVITYDMVKEPAGSVLWELRRKQDDLFLK